MYLPLCRGCLFITYEMVALDKAVTVDTSAVQQEKYKSFIYLRATPSAENENFASGNQSNSKNVSVYFIFFKEHFWQIQSTWRIFGKYTQYKCISYMCTKSYSFFPRPAGSWVLSFFLFCFLPLSTVFPV